MSQNDNPIIVGLDIGTTKIAAIAGRKNEFGKLEILGFGRANSNGVQHGQVLNIDQTIRAIHQALENCQKSNPDLEINEVYVGIAGHHIKSLQTRGDIVRQDPEMEINPAEIEQLINNLKNIRFSDKPTHLKFDSEKLEAKIVNYCDRKDILLELNELLVIEYYSR